MNLPIFRSPDRPSPPPPLSPSHSRIVGWLLLGLLILVQAGCSRAYWRRNANAEAYGLIREKTRLDGRWSVPRTDIVPSPLSRMYDPAHPDYGALPPDDLTAHRYMHHMSDFDRIHGSDFWYEIGMGNSIENPGWVASLPNVAEKGVPVAGKRRAVGDAEKERPLAFWDRFAVAEMWRDSPLAGMFQTHGGADEPSRSSRGERHFVVTQPRPDRDGVIGQPAETMVAQSESESTGSSGTGTEAPSSEGTENSIQLADYQEPLATPSSEEAVEDEGEPVPPVDGPTFEMPPPVDTPSPAPADTIQAPIPYRLPDARGGEAGAGGNIGPTYDSDRVEGGPAVGSVESEAEREPEQSAEATAPDLSASNPALPAVQELTLEEAVALSYLHGRNYQFAIEDLYLAALDLSFDRFQFDVRFLGIGGNRPGADLNYEGTSDGVQSLTGTARVGISRLLPAGGQWAAELANQTLWLFSDSPNESGTMSTLTFSFVQPLLFAAGRKVVLEDLTQSERNVLYAARDLSRFRKTLFVNTVTSGGGGGFLGLLQSIQQISNQEGNIRRLEYQLEVSEANEQNTDALSRTQLESTLLGRLNGIRQSRASLQNDLDQFKIQLGLPPDMDLSLDTTFLEPFQLISDVLFALESELEDEFLRQWQTVNPANPSPRRMREAVVVLDKFVARVRQEALPLIAEDFDRVEENLPRRLADLPQPIGENRQRVRENAETDRQFYENARKQLREQAAFIENLSERLVGIGAAEAVMDAIYEAVRVRDERRSEMFTTPEERRLAYLDVLGAYDDLLRLTRNLQGIQIGLRTELIALNPFEMPMSRAVGYALTNRLDLMNQRAAVMDARRKVEVAANQLRGVLDVRVEQDVSTRPLLNGDNPLDFRRTNSTFRAGLSFTAPLSQIAQRNAYRVAQIDYQRARRNYMEAEDRVKLDVRQAWRQLQVLKQNFEVARYAVRVAAQQYDQAVEETANPEQQAGGGAGRSGLNVINALNSVLGAQNDLIGIWVNYESARLNIYRDMGIMEIDPRGLWVDPFYQNGMKRPREAVEGPPGWNGSEGSAPARLPAPADPLPIPPAPSGDSGVRISGGGSTLAWAFSERSRGSRVLPVSYPPGRHSTAAAELIPPKSSSEAGHVRSRSRPSESDIHPDRGRPGGAADNSGETATRSGSTTTDSEESGISLGMDLWTRRGDGRSPDGVGLDGAGETSGGSRLADIFRQRD